MYILLVLIKTTYIVRDNLGNNRNYLHNYVCYENDIEDN